jgi:hypothetical protein
MFTETDATSLDDVPRREDAICLLKLILGPQLLFQRQRLLHVY